jgi:DedD protein
VLTLAVVVILPMVLDSEPRPSGQDIDLRIPSADKVGEFVPGVAASEMPAVAPSAASAVAPVPVVAVSVVPGATSAIPAAAVSSVVQSDSAKSAGSTAAAAPDKEPDAAAGAKAETAAKVQPVPEKTAEPKNTEQPAGESLVAQVGAYSNAETAKQEMLKLKKWGFKAYTEKIGDKFRVRVGPYTERDKVEKVRQLLEKHGLHPVIVSVR